MKNKTLKIGVILVMLFCAFFLNACSAKIKVTKANKSDFRSMVSRKNTNYICSSPNFGGGTTDEMFVVLNYVYHNKEMKEKYGNSFEVSDIGGSTDNQTFMFYQLYKGKGKYFVDINKDEWIVKISKSYFGKWKVTSCSLSKK